MAPEARHRAIGLILRKLVDKTKKYINDKLKEESGCGKCGVCHRVCKLLDQKPTGRGGN